MASFSAHRKNHLQKRLSKTDINIFCLTRVTRLTYLRPNFNSPFFNSPAYGLQWNSGKLFFKTSPTARQMVSYNTFTDEVDKIDLPEGSDSFTVLRAGALTKKK